MLDTLIVNGTVISEGVSRQAKVGIKNGRIACLLDKEMDIPAGETIDASGLWVLPGIIDAHVHCRAPGNPAWGDFATETRAAAAGGVTTILEMPISTPACATPEIFCNRRELGESQAYVNFGLYGGPTTLSQRNIEGMAREGAIGFKIFTTNVPRGRESDFDGLCATDDFTLREALRLVQPTQLPCSVHAESAELIGHFQSQLRNEARNEPTAHSAAQPPIVEAIVVSKLIALAAELNARVHIAHLSTKLSLELVQAARHHHIPITAETCPHYILFDESALEAVGPYAKINPPLRKSDDQAALDAGIRDGTFSFIASDHSPFDAAAKEVGWQNIWAAQPGCPGLEALLFFILNYARTREYPIAEALRLITDKPAQHFSLYPRKGVIDVGSDGDVVLVDPEADGTIHTAEWYTIARDNAKLYEGLGGKGKVIRTIVGGRTVYLNQEIVGHPGTGRFVRPD